MSENGAIAVIICAIAVAVFSVSHCVRELVSHQPENSSVACVKAGGRWKDTWGAGYCEAK